MSESSVLHVALAPGGGGAELLVRELVQRLPDVGIHAEGLYFSRRPRLDAPPWDLLPREVSLEAPSYRSPRVLPALRRSLVAFASAHPGGVVHTHTTWPLVYVRAVARGLGLRFVHTEHDSYNRRRSARVYQQFDRRLYRRLESCICISDGVEAALLEHLGPDCVRTEVIENGARLFPVVEREVGPGEPMRLVSVGSLIPKKGFDLALEAVARLGDAVASYEIVGEGEQRGELEAQVRTLGLREKVTLLGWQSDLEPIFARANAMLVPSRWEGFGLVAIEGMSSGLPIAAADVPGLREVVGDAGITMALGIDDIEAALRALHTRFAQYRDWSAASRRRAEAFSLDRMVERYGAVYRRRP